MKGQRSASRVLVLQSLCRFGRFESFCIRASSFFIECRCHTCSQFESLWSIRVRFCSSETAFGDADEQLFKRHLCVRIWFSNRRGFRFDFWSNRIFQRVRVFWSRSSPELCLASCINLGIWSE